MLDGSAIETVAKPHTNKVLKPRQRKVTEKGETSW